MKIYFAASEADPFAKSGGLGDVAAALPRQLANMGYDVRVVLPMYSNIPHQLRKEFTYKYNFYVEMPKVHQYAGVFTYEHQGVQYYFIDNEYYFARNGLYGFFDDGERFSFYNRALLDLLIREEFYPDIIHLNDWHTGAAAALFKEFYAHQPGFEKTRTIFTIHNLKYQGIFPYSVLKDYLGLGDEYFSYDKMEHFGNINFLKAGLSLADFVTTVSQTYASELQYAYYSEGLHSLILHRANDIRGIVNGIDVEHYNPATDPDIFKNYDSEHIEGKKKNKTELQKLLGLHEDPDVPLLGLISRLTPQKGLDLLAFIFDELMEENVQVVLLGSGKEEIENQFLEFSHRYRSKASANIFFSPSLAKKIYAASDIFLMPSRFEPCGLGQLIAMRYGSVPVVRKTGGLADTVVPYNRFTGEGTGFAFQNFNAHELLFTIKDALYYYHNDVTAWKSIIKQAMETDHSWKSSAEEYARLYKELIAK